jgi:hypothetical protein
LVAPQSARGCSAARTYIVEDVETVTMTVEQYDEAVNALAALIVRWARDRAHADRSTDCQADSG